MVCNALLEGRPIQRTKMPMVPNTDTEKIRSRFARITAFISKTSPKQIGLLQQWQQHLGKQPDSFRQALR